MEVLYNLFRSFTMNASQILLDIHALEEELIAFERKYGIRSETFHAAYANGEEPENDEWVLDFSEWASVYKTWLERQSQYRDEVQRIQRNKPTLAGLIRVAGT
jgi:hypothetical protein